jgi:sugar phosphate isomerase/epimerase
MRRRTFVRQLGAALAALAAPAALPAALRAAGTAGAARRVGPVGLQLYSLRDDARRDLARTLAAIAGAGYASVELLGSMRNFGMAPARLRQVLDELKLRAPSTHVAASALDDLPRQLDEARVLGHEYLIVAGFPAERRRTVDDYRRWADRLNAAGAAARRSNVWVGFHNHADDLLVTDGRTTGYDVLLERTDPAVVRMQLDTGNLAMAGRDPLAYMERHAERYWSFHVKDVPRLRATEDAELGKGIIDFRALLARVPRLAEKHLFVEQETYPGAPIDSVRRDFAYLTKLEF